MVNEVVLEYLRTHRGNYKLDDLKKKILTSGYSQQDVSDASNQLNKESSGKTPEVSATINKINKTNIDMNTNMPIDQRSVNMGSNKQMQTPKKRKWGKTFDYSFNYSFNFRRNRCRNFVVS